jgi:hypothetical protein
MFRATVPKAAVHKNGGPAFWKDKIRVAKEWEIPTPAANFVFSENRGKFDFRGFVPLGLDCGHHL